MSEDQAEINSEIIVSENEVEQVEEQLDIPLVDIIKPKSKRIPSDKKLESLKKVREARNESFKHKRELEKKIKQLQSHGVDIDILLQELDRPVEKVEKVEKKVKPVKIKKQEEEPVEEQEQPVYQPRGYFGFRR
jgi:hypothetical protein